MEASIIEASVFRGLWTDWSRGSVMGLTLTLERRQGNILIAFMAAFIAMVAVRFWHIMCIILFRIFSTSESRPAPHHQRQVILRNSLSSPEAALWALLGLVWAWRRRGSNLARLLKVVLPVAMLATVNIVLFTAAGVISSSITSAIGDVVLLKSSDSRCGFQGPTNATELALQKMDWAAAYENAASYAKQCYSGDAPGLLDCNRFVQPRLPLQSDTTAECPFPDPDVCRSNTRNIRLDSGYVDVHHWLGLNTPPSQPSSLRFVAQCAPLKTEGRTSRIKTSNATLVRYHYGERILSTVSDGSPDQIIDYTYQIRDVESQYQYYSDDGDVTMGGNFFKLNARSSTKLSNKPGTVPGSFIPSAELARSDGDVDLFFLAGNGVILDYPLEDDWYRLTREGPRLGDKNTKDSSGRPSYMASEPASPLGCAFQFQFCNLGQCGNLSSFKQALSDAKPLFNLTSDFSLDPLSPPPAHNRDGVRLWWISTLLSAPLPVETLYLQEVRSFASQRILRGGALDALSRNATLWHREITDWFQIYLATWQGRAFIIPLGPTAPEAQPARKTFHPSLSDSPVLQTLCNSQKVRSGQYTSFSFFGLAFTYAVGSTIIIVSWSLEAILAKLYQRYGYQEHEQLEWVTSAPLQLHRLAQEELGDNDWSGCAETVPVVVRNEGQHKCDAHLANLDVTNPDHPVLSRKPASTLGHESASTSHTIPVKTASEKTHEA